MRERRAKYENQKNFVDQVIYEGTMRMREEAKETLKLVKKAMGLSGIWNKISRKARGE
ncbi:hypothetical protein [Treponema phagedenis]|nr:hypothetical protein [Treponema phagedenis]